MNCDYNAIMYEIQMLVPSPLFCTSITAFPVQLIDNFVLVLIIVQFAVAESAEMTKKSFQKFKIISN